MKLSSRLSGSLVVGLFVFVSCSQTANRIPKERMDNPNSIAASGTLAPDGPPAAPPARIDAGRSCIVDLRQSYSISGTLSGTLDISYRIKVDGPCGSPIGTFDEDWIAHGTFSGTVDGQPGQAAFTYVATVKAGGDVNGDIVFGQGLEGELQVTGNFSDGKLSYKGRLSR